MVIYSSPMSGISPLTIIQSNTEDNGSYQRAQPEGRKTMARIFWEQGELSSPFNWN
jgi:hypothetical protein